MVRFGLVRVYAVQRCGESAVRYLRMAYGLLFMPPTMHWYSRLDTTLATFACTECTAYTSNPLLLLMAASSGIRNICRYYSPEAKHSFERIMEIIYGAKTVFTRSVITPLKVHYDCVCSRYSISISIL